MNTTLPSLRRVIANACRALPTRATLRRQKDHIAAALQQAGLHAVGSGRFGRVHANDRLAVKMVQTRESQAYLEYARYCRRFASTNRLLPRVFAIQSAGRFSFVFMEALIHQEEDAKTLSRSLRRVSRGQGKLRVNEVSRIIGRKPSSLACTVLKLEKILAKHPKAFWDLRGDNVLFRAERGQLKMVLTDPIAC